MKRVSSVGIVLVLAVVVAACGSTTTSTSGITVSEAWVRNPPIADQPGAAYLVIQNGGSADKLLSVTSDVAQMIELHQSMESGGMMQMSPVSNIEVPANGKVELKPGGFHMMLMGLTRPLKLGDKVQFTLNFEKAGKIPVTAEVKDQGLLPDPLLS